MEKIKSEDITEGQIIKLKHIGDDGKKMYHPFLVICISNKIFLALQLTSIDDKGSTYNYQLNLFENLRLKVFNEISLTNNNNYLTLPNNIGLEKHSVLILHTIYWFYWDDVNDESIYLTELNDALWKK